MKVRLGLQFRFFVIYLIFGLCMTYGMYTIVQKSYVRIIYEKYYENALGIGNLAACILNGDKVTEYVQTGQTDAEYDEWKRQFNNMKDNMDVYYLYVMYPITDEKVVYVMEADFTEEQREQVQGEAGTLGEEVSSWDTFAAAKDVYHTGLPSSSLEVTTTLQVAEIQTLGSVYVPVMDSNQKVVALIGVDVLMSDIVDYMKDATGRVVISIVIFSSISLIAMLLIIRFSVIHPIKILQKYAEEMEQGVFGNQIKVRGRDEVSEISRVFNRMNINIGKHLNEVEIINQAYYKYVPSEIFHILNRNSVTEVQLGDYANEEMSVMSYSIKNFDSLVKRMDAVTMFQFINETLHLAIPEITKEQGFIQEFHEGGFTALHTESCEKNLQAALAICEQIRNRTVDGAEINTVSAAIGISYGAVMMGIVGHDNRMATVSVASATIMADFLKNICLKYNASILITAAAASEIKGFEKKYRHRFLGFIYHSYAKNGEKIYDVYDGDEENVRRAKTLTKEWFEKGVELFCIKRFDEARTQFIAVLKQYNKDSAAREYLYLCNQYCQMQDVSQTDIYIERYE